MTKKFYCLVFVAIFIFFTSHSYAAPTWTGNKSIDSIEAVESGGFIINFSTPLASSCVGAGPSTVYIYPNQNAVTLDGLKTLYATAMMAFVTGKQISVLYDSASNYCWGQYVFIQK